MLLVWDTASSPALWTSRGFPQELPAQARNGWRERWYTVWCGPHMPYPEHTPQERTEILIPVKKKYD